MTPELQAKNRRTGLCLLAVLMGVIGYSLIVITTRGHRPLPSPKEMTSFQKMQRR